jgi:hypothetical protein
LLAVACAWRWRDRLVEPALAVAGGIALKLFLWPLVPWLALTRRVRAAVASVAATVFLVAIPWAVIGFGGIGGYAGLLRHLSRDEASSSYSIVALAVRAHLPYDAGIALSLLFAVVLLGGAAWAVTARGVSSHNRDVVVLTLALAAALAASPIVWIHYFVLLLVPLALTQPRLSLLWFVPFAYSALGEAAWPAGDAGKLAISLVATLLIFGGAIFEALRVADRPARRASPVVQLRARSQTRSG